MAASPAASSRRSAASSSASLKHSDDHQPKSPTISVDTLVNHLLVAKRSLSSMNHVLRANELATSARHSHEEMLLLAAQTAFVRNYLRDQNAILVRIRRSLQATYEWGKRDFKKLIKAMDEVDGALTGTMDMLRDTHVQTLLQPNDGERKNLLDFVDESSVHGMREVMKKSIQDLQNIQQSFDGDLLRLETDIRNLGQRINESYPQKPGDDVHLTPMVLLQSLDDHSSTMAQLLASLTKHFDMCVTAIRTTEGAAALARRKAAEVTQSQSSDGVSISGVIAEQESHMSDLEPKTAEDRAEMLKVVVQDADEVEDVVREIQERLAAMEQEYTSLQEHVDHSKESYFGIISAFALVGQIGDRIDDYVAAEEDFRLRWELEKEAVFGKVREMNEMRDFYEGYASAYGSLVLEVERRRAVDERVQGIWRKAQDSVDKILEADRVSREAFRQDVGEYLPADLWAGMQGPAQKWTVVRINDDDSAAASMSDATLVKWVEPRKSQTASDTWTFTVRIGTNHQTSYITTRRASMRLRDDLILGLSALAAAGAATPEFDWDSISPSTDLQYHDCYTAFKCARLKLPLDWKNSTDPRTAAIAIIKLPAKVPADDPAFGGPIFTNPGGPGGSGVSFVVSRGHYLRDYVDSPGKKHYDIVSFDPRGIGNSRPLANCFPGAALARDAWMLETRGNGGLDKSLAAISYGLALYDGYGRKCEKADVKGLNGGEIFKYLGTPSVARDMVAMVDSIDELRKTEAARDGRTELKKRNEGDVPRLQYMGFSYGTILGNYFASLFPGRIGRIVLDGVCNADDYATGAGWLTNTVDSDTIIDKFFDGCFHAGPQVCHLARRQDRSGSDLRTRFWPWLKQLDEAPVAGVGPLGSSIILTGADIRLVLAMAAYTPLKSFIQVAELLDNAMVHGNYDPILATIESGLGAPLQDACPVANQTANPNTGSDPQTAVLCGDGGDIRGKKPSWWARYVEKQFAQSAIFGGLWSTVRFPCSGWRFKPNWSFHGPFTTPEPPRDGERPQRGQPAAPLMFLTNRLDPVTPLAAARAMAKNHPGAKVVVQEAMGHCAAMSAYSECTRGVVAGYFDTGKLPDREVVCEAECGPWDDGCSRTLLKSDGEDAGEAWFARRFPLGV